MSTNKSAGTPIEGATALVTGGNRGFGRALVDELLDRGAAKVYATSRSPHQSGDERIVPLVLDVSDDDSVAAAAHAAPDASIVVNNAGTTLSTPVLNAPLDDIQSELETNLFGLIRVARAFAPILARLVDAAVMPAEHSLPVGFERVGELGQRLELDRSDLVDPAAQVLLG